MARGRMRLAALALGVISTLSTTGGIANADPSRTYLTAYKGPFSEEAPCNQYSFYTNAPPDVIATACFYTSTGIPGYDWHPGWWFQYRYSID